MPFVDTHCHLDHHRELAVDTQVERARDADVAIMVTVGTDVDSSRQAVATAARFGDVWAAVGIHPNDAATATGEALAELDRLASQPRVVAIGETGLDFYRDWATPADQETAFRAQIDLAKAHDLALVIHCREAWPELLALLDDHGAPDRVVMHCFSGDAAVVERCTERGWHMSYAGNVTFANAGELRAAAALTPLELLLTETDSPYLTPHPHRGTPNDPSYVGLTLRALAVEQGRDVDEVAAAVLDNTRRVFALDG